MSILINELCIPFPILIMFIFFVLKDQSQYSDVFIYAYACTQRHISLSKQKFLILSTSKHHFRVIIIFFFLA